MLLQAAPSGKDDLLRTMTSSNGNIFRVTGHLCGEFTGHRWIPLTKGSDAELWINGWINNREAGHLRRHRAQYDVIIMCWLHTITYTSANSLSAGDSRIKLEWNFDQNIKCALVSCQPVVFRLQCVTIGNVPQPEEYVTAPSCNPNNFIVELKWRHTTSSFLVSVPSHGLVTIPKTIPWTFWMKYNFHSRKSM